MATADDISIPARAARLKLARKAKFRWASDAASHVGVHQVTLRAHEAGQNGFPIETAELYATAFGVNINWLLTGDGEPGDLTPTTETRSDPPWTVRALAGGKARIDLGMTLPMTTVLQILALVQGDEK